MGKKDIFFSIIIACYNLEEYIGPCLESIVNQDYDHNSFEIICIDDGSADRSPQIIERYASRFNNFIHMQIENSGLEHACNYGIRLACSERIVRVDADDMVARDFLSQMNHAIRKKPGFDFYYCKNYVEYYSETKQFQRELPDFEPNEIFSRGDFFATGTVYRKSDLESIGFFSEEIKNTLISSRAMSSSSTNSLISVVPGCEMPTGPRCPSFTFPN